MKNGDLQDTLALYPRDLDVQVVTRIVVPDDEVDLSEADQLIEDGEVLELDEKDEGVVAPSTSGQELYIYADKVFD